MQKQIPYITTYYNQYLNKLWIHYYRNSLNFFQRKTSFLSKTKFSFILIRILSRSNSYPVFNIWFGYNAHVYKKVSPMPLNEYKKPNLRNPSHVLLHKLKKYKCLVNYPFCIFTWFWFLLFQFLFFVGEI